jgi:hypothetical protein
VDMDNGSLLDECPCPGRWHVLIVAERREVDLQLVLPDISS